MMSYLVTIVTDHRINEQLQKTSGADVLLSKKKIRKTIGGGGEQPPHLVCLKVKR